MFAKQRNKSIFILKATNLHMLLANKELKDFTAQMEYL